MAAHHTQDSPTRTSPQAWWRRVGSWLLLVMFCLSMVLSLVSIWARNQVLDTTIYVDTVAPLAADPAIQEAIADRVTALVSDRLQLDEVVEDSLSNRDTLLRSAAVPIVLDFVHRTVLGFVQSSEFQEFWKDANSIAHRELLQVLTSDDSSLRVDEDRLILDLSPIVTSVEERLRASGLDVSDRLTIDPATAVFVLVESPAIEKAQWAIRLIDTLSIVLPIVAFASFVGCLLLAYDRWTMLLRSGIGMAVGGVVLVVGLAYARSWYLDGLGAGLNRHALTAVFDIELRGLLASARVLTLIGLAIAGVAALAGSDWIRQPAITAFMSRYRSGLLAGVLAIACLVLILVEQVSSELLVGIGIGGLVSAAAIIWLSHQSLAFETSGEVHE